MPDRTTIVMPAELKSRTMARARREKVSFGEYVRRAVEDQLSKPVKTMKVIHVNRGKRKTGDPFWDNLKVFVDDGPTDMSARVDDYYYEALEDELRRHRSVPVAVPPKRPASSRSTGIVAASRKAGVHKQPRHR